MVLNFCHKVYISPKIHLAEITLAGSYISPKTYFPEFFHFRNYIRPNHGIFPKAILFSRNALARNYRWQKFHFPETLFLRNEIFPKIHFRKLFFIRKIMIFYSKSIYVSIFNKQNKLRLKSSADEI